MLPNTICKANSSSASLLGFKKLGGSYLSFFLSIFYFTPLSYCLHATDDKPGIIHFLVLQIRCFIGFFFFPLLWLLSNFLLCLWFSTIWIWYASELMFWFLSYLVSPSFLELWCGSNFRKFSVTFLAMQRAMWDLSSPTKDQTHAHWIGSIES